MKFVMDHVKAGAMVLDEINPGWYERINTETLDIASCTSCILGQLYGSYEDGIEELHSRGIRLMGKGFSGTSAMWPGKGWEELTAMWRELIQAKKTKKTQRTEKVEERELVTV